MSVIIENKEFTDSLGNATNFYQSNAGDRVTAQITVASKIRVTSVNNPLTLDPTLNAIESPVQDWEEIGFREGDFMEYRVYSSAGVLEHSGNVEIQSISGASVNLVSFTSANFYDISAQEVMEFWAVTDGTGTTTKKRGDLELHVNHSLNSQQGNQASLIDGETTIVKFNGVDGLAVSGSLNADLVGKQSGQFIESATITYTGTNADDFDTYEIDFTFINSGVYDSEWFSNSDCLKFFIKGLWSANGSEPFNRFEWAFDNSANTGWYNEPYNAGVNQGSGILSGISEVSYNQVNNGTFNVDIGSAALGTLGIGSAYLSIDDNYYKNRVEPQQNITMIIPTTDASGMNETSFIGVENSASYTFVVNSITLVAGTEYEIDYTLTFDSGFETFMNNRVDGDRLFYIWCRVGNSNYLLYADQLQEVLPVGGALTMVQDYGYLDHAHNVVSRSTDLTGGYIADTEDDLAYFGAFQLEDGVTDYEQLNVIVEAFNSTTGADFELQKTVFNFSAFTYNSSTGQYLFDSQQPINNNLPTTSKKKTAIFKKDDNYNGVGVYGVSIYYPFLLNWRYWLGQTGVNADFYPNTNKNWEQYDNLGDWGLRLKLELVKGGLAFTHTSEFTDRDYNADADVDSTIKLYKQSDSSEVSIIPEGEALYVEAVHELNTGTWDAQKVWGMITVEPFEGAPRWICSTIVPTDNNAQNPLTPESGMIATLEFPSATIVKIRCNFDSSKVDLTNGVKFGSKVKEGDTDIVEIGKTTTDNELKNTTDDEIKILA